MFAELQDEAAAHPTHSASLLQYVAYFERQWMRNTSVPKQMWRVHNVACQKRTNNDTEGWNNKWNRAIAKAGPGVLDTTRLCCRLVSSKVTRRTYSHRLLAECLHHHATFFKVVTFASVGLLQS